MSPWRSWRYAGASVILWTRLYLLSCPPSVPWHCLYHLCFIITYLSWFFFLNVFTSFSCGCLQLYMCSLSFLCYLPTFFPLFMSYLLLFALLFCMFQVMKKMIIVCWPVQRKEVALSSTILASTLLYVWSWWLTVWLSPQYCRPAMSMTMRELLEPALALTMPLRCVIMSHTSQGTKYMFYM